MTKSEFLDVLQDLFQREEKVLEADSLADYPEWDSLSKMVLMAYYSKTFGIKLAIADFDRFGTVADLIAAAGDQVNA